MDTDNLEEKINQRSLEIIEAMEKHREQLGGRADTPDPKFDIGFLIQKIAGLQLSIELMASDKPMLR